MFKRNPQIELFREMKIESFFEEFEGILQNKIDRETTDAINKSYALGENIIDSPWLEVPILLKNETSTYIFEERLRGHELPIKEGINLGKFYDIESTRYSIPFTGNREFFKCLPTSQQSRTVMADLNVDSITLKLVYWDKITGNDEAIEYLRKELLKHVEVIESYLHSLQEDVDKFIPVLEKRINNYIDNSSKHTAEQSMSSQRINPFS